MSSHSTADAIDISGFFLRDGQRIDLKQDWSETSQKGQFLNAVGQDACDWFPLVLGPNYNAAHADHFHLQSSGWNFCR